MAAIIIPSTFTAIDKVTSVVKAMGASISKDFVGKAETGLSRLDKFSKKLIPGLGEASKQFLAFASTAAITAAIIGGITFTTKSIRDYETALTSVQTITGLSKDAFAPFKTEIADVANKTNESAIEVAKSFELIASANADLLKSPKSLGQVSKAAITLAQATGMSIADAAGSLTNAMNQFGVDANSAQSYIDILVTSQAAGTATVKQLAESLTVAGGTAKAFGLDFDKTNALLQGFAKGGKVGSEAGTMLSGVLSKLSKTSKKEFNPVHTDAVKVIDNLAKANLSYTDLMKLTDAEGAKWLSTLINQNKIVQELSGKQNVQNAAMAAAENQTGTFDKAIEQLTNRWVNMVVTSDKSTSGLNMLTRAVKFLTKNLDTVVTLVVMFTGAYLALRTAIIVSRVSLIAYNVAVGIYNALFTTSLVLTNQNIIAQRAYAIASKVAVFAIDLFTGAQWLLNAALTANPIGAIIVAIAALIALIIVAVAKYNEWGAALTFLLGPFGIIINLVQAFRRNWDMITAAFKEGGIMAGIKAIGAVLLDSILMPMEQLLGLIAKATGADWASKA